MSYVVVPTLASLNDCLVPALPSLRSGGFFFCSAFSSWRAVVVWERTAELEQERQRLEDERTALESSLARTSEDMAKFLERRSGIAMSVGGVLASHHRRFLARHVFDKWVALAQHGRVTALSQAHLARVRGLKRDRLLSTMLQVCLI